MLGLFLFRLKNICCYGNYKLYIKQRKDKSYEERRIERESERILGKE